MRASRGHLQAGSRLWDFGSAWQHFRSSPEIVDLVKRGHTIKFYSGRRPKICVGLDLKKETRLPGKLAILIITVQLTRLSSSRRRWPSCVTRAPSEGCRWRRRIGCRATTHACAASLSPPGPGDRSSTSSPWTASWSRRTSDWRPPETSSRRCV